MNIIVNEELKAYIDPLTPEEYASLERSILTEGCRDALVLWGDLLIDGHNRYAICQAHGLPFQTVQATLFQTMEDVHLWMIEQHLGRRSVSDFQRGVLALRKREILSARRAKALAMTPAQADEEGSEPAPQIPPWEDAAVTNPAQMDKPLASREDIAKAARLSSSQVVLIEKIQKQAAPELVAAVKSGVISLNAAAAVASLPVDDQVAAAAAGKDELKQAAKRVREARRQSRTAPAGAADQVPLTPPESMSADDEIKALQQRVAQLEKENDALRKQVLNLLEKSSRLA
ncbi:plasmid replication/partition related protein [Rhodoferax sp.]|uniref:plasmid replication/partition related protein n=1 Tax=Rhodoferax sp. TaxID=50421 RepID=UPI0026297482|nr:plasmid replication/partition related protein [Rhodoferax sp.]MDD2925758.1 plasmid replication/partition related protein [Rhodoferax sp.]